MKLTNITIALVLSETRNAELNKRVEGFERMTKTLSTEIDRQRKEIELMSQKGKVLKFNHLRRVA
jgi:hypothetical protein